jgi:hypothetical protein
MTWILLEGLDRSGKSTVAEIYKKQGYEVVHMSAPDKKFSQPGYSGPSYLEEIVNIYSIYAGKDVLFDRTIYGEEVWPEIYNRMPLLNDEDFEYLQRLEYNNDAVRYLMHDEDQDAHWQRCVDNKEPLNRVQFVTAGRLYDNLAEKHSFELKQLGDFEELGRVEPPNAPDKDVSTIGDIRQDTKVEPARAISVSSKASLESKLERANAIRSLLGGVLVKKKGEIYKGLEEDIKEFLEQELQEIFTEPKKQDFTQEEVQILKLTAQRMRDKLG